MFKDSLQIVIITCDRRKYLDNTLKQLLDSPFNNCEILIIDNASNDRTYQTIKEYYNNYENIKIIKNKYNIGGNANIVEAYRNCSSKIKYSWVICDDDTLVTSDEGLKELQDAMNENCDIIVAAANYLTHGNYNYGQLFKQFSFVPSTIFKTELITSDVISCMYDNVYSMLPHLAFYCVIFNENRSIKVLNHNFIERGQDFSEPSEYMRTRNYCSPYRENMSWFVGYCNSIQLIKNEEVKQKIIDDSLLCVGCGSLFSGIMFELNLNNNYYKSCLKNVTDMFASFNSYKRFLLMIALLTSPIRKKYNIKNTVDGFRKYFIKKKINKVLNGIFKKYKNKKILLYGAGMYTEALLQANIDDSIKNNIKYVADNKFVRGRESKWNDFTAINPNDITKYGFDVILVSVYQFGMIKRILKHNDIKAKIVPVVSQNYFEKTFCTRV